tara:strand:- start:3719 stop:4087 length:369 start_codon:yes stop_codon:yes gene_type:complete
MRLTKRQLKRIIREEYTKLKKRGLIRESMWPVNDAGEEYDPVVDQEMLGGDLGAEILDLAFRPEGVSLDELNDLYGAAAFDKVDEMCEEGICWLDDTEGVVYASGSQPSAGLGPAQDRYVNY